MFSDLGKNLALIIVFLILFFSYITAVNSSSLLGRQLITAQNMKEEQKTKYNETVTELSAYTSQSAILASQKSDMIPIDRNSSDFISLKKLQDQHLNAEEAENGISKGKGKTEIIR